MGRETALGGFGVRPKYPINGVFQRAQRLGWIKAEPQDPRRPASASRRKHAGATKRKLEGWHANLAQVRPHVTQPIFRRVAQKPQGDVQLLGPRPARAAYALAQTRDRGSKFCGQVHRNEEA